MASIATTPPVEAPAVPPGRIYTRHGVIIRLCHWINVVCILFLIASGLNIFNAHPALYWGKFGANADIGRRWLSIDSSPGPNHGVIGTTQVGAVTVNTSGLLGTHRQPDGTVEEQGFPDWATFPTTRDLATARRWHFFFAWTLILNGLVYLIYGFATRHLQDEVWPRLRQLAPANVWHDIVQHAKLRFPRGEDDKYYHILQRLAYAGTVFFLLPMMILTGLSMSPGFDAAADGLLPSLFGGRASARSFHFITMNLVVAFIVIHVAMVILAGPFNQLRSMISGRYDVGTPREESGT